MKKSKYGIYPGFLKDETKYLETCTEIELFIQVNTYYETIRKIMHFDKLKENCNDKKIIKHYDQKISEILKQEIKKDSLFAREIEEYLYTMDYCILQTKRFETQVEYNPNGRIILTNEFKTWYENWQLYIDTMDKDTLEYYRRCRYQGTGFENFKLNKTISKKEISKNDDEKTLKTVKPYTYILLPKNIRQNLA